MSCYTSPSTTDDMGSNGSKDYDLLPRCFWSEEDLELETTQLGRLNVPLKTSKSALTERVRRTHQSGMRRPEQSKVVFGWFSRSSNHWPFLFFFGAKPNWNIWNLVGVRLPCWSRQGLKLQSARRERFGAGGMICQNKSGDSGEPVGATSFEISRPHDSKHNVNIIFLLFASSASFLFKRQSCLLRDKLSNVPRWFSSAPHWKTDC